MNGHNGTEVLGHVSSRRRALLLRLRDGPRSLTVLRVRNEQAGIALTFGSYLATMPASDFCVS